MAFNPMELLEGDPSLFFEADSIDDEEEGSIPPTPPRGVSPPPPVCNDDDDHHHRSSSSVDCCCCCLELVPAIAAQRDGPFALGHTWKADGARCGVRVVAGKGTPEDAAGFREFACSPQSSSSSDSHVVTPAPTPNSSRPQMGWRVAWVSDGHWGAACVMRIAELLDSMQEALTKLPSVDGVEEQIERCLEAFHSLSARGGATFTCCVQLTRNGRAVTMRILHIGDSQGWVCNTDGVVYRTQSHIGEAHGTDPETRRVQSEGGRVCVRSADATSQTALEECYRGLLRDRLEHGMDAAAAAAARGWPLNSLLDRRDLCGVFELSDELARALHTQWQGRSLGTYLNGFVGMTRSLGDWKAGPGHSSKPTWSPWLEPAPVLLMSDGVSDHLELPPWMSFDPSRYPVGTDAPLLAPMRSLARHEISASEAADVITDWAKDMWSTYSHLGTAKEGFTPDMDDVAVAVLAGP